MFWKYNEELGVPDHTQAPGVVGWDVGCGMKRI